MKQEMIYTFEDVQVIRQVTRDDLFMAGVFRPLRTTWRLIATGATRDEAIRNLRNLLVEHNLPFDFSGWEPTDG